MLYKGKWKNGNEDCWKSLVDIGLLEENPYNHFTENPHKWWSKI